MSENLSTIFEMMPDPLVIVDQTGRIVFVNSQIVDLFGYERHELLNQFVEVLIPERYRDQHIHHRDRYFIAPKVRPMGEIWSYLD